MAMALRIQRVGPYRAARRLGLTSCSSPQTIRYVSTGHRVGARKQLGPTCSSRWVMRGRVLVIWYRVIRQG
eukprot:3148330-Rhodomonas_salina.1